MHIWWSRFSCLPIPITVSYRHSKYLIQLKLYTTATLGTEKSGHCREMVVVEVETTVNVRTVRLKKMAVRL